MENDIFKALADPNKLVMSWRFISFPGTESDPPSRITWEIGSHAELHGVTVVTVVHDEFEQAANTATILANGLTMVLSGMKTLLETGKMLARD